MQGLERRPGAGRDSPYAPGIGGDIALRPFLRRRRARPSVGEAASLPSTRLIVPEAKRCGRQGVSVACASEGLTGVLERDAIRVSGTPQRQITM